MRAPAGPDRQRGRRAGAARRLWRGSRRFSMSDASGLAPRPARLGAGARCRSSRNYSGTSPTKAFGRCAAAGRHFTHSKVMAWVAFDRAVRSAEEFGLEAPWSAGAHSRRHPRRGLRRVSTRSAIASCSPMARDLDASLLLIPMVGFLPPDDPRVRGTLAAIEGGLIARRLRAALRHAATDRRPAAGRRRLPGLQFLAGRQLRAAGPLTMRARCSSGCSRCATTSACWRKNMMFARRQVGNFPQALSHLALVNTRGI